MATQAQVSATDTDNKAELTKLFAVQGLDVIPTQAALNAYSQIIRSAYRSGYDEGIDTMKSDWP